MGQGGEWGAAVWGGVGSLTPGPSPTVWARGDQRRQVANFCVKYVSSVLIGAS